jgi:hypothetical protein
MVPVDDLVAEILVAVERLAWVSAGGLSDPRIGPVHLHFESGRGAFFSGGTDWTLEVVMTSAADESWLSSYPYDGDGGRWTLRDAALEPPFALVLGARLSSWTSLRNKMGEQVGMMLDFDKGSVTLKVHAGEVTT